MVTNEQATREPLLSDDAIATEVGPRDPKDYSAEEYYETIGAKWCRDFYEAKITSGELAVVKTAHIVMVASDREQCSACETNWDYLGFPVVSCPGCGAKIAKP